MTMHIMRKPPRDYAEVAAVELLAMQLAQHYFEDEFWDALPLEHRNEYRTSAHKLIEEAMEFWNATAKPDDPHAGVGRGGMP